MGKGNYSATSNTLKLVHWPLMGGVLRLVQWEGDWAGLQPAQVPPSCTTCNSPPINGQCTNHRIAVYWSMLCCFNVPIKGLTCLVWLAQTSCSDTTYQSPMDLSPFSPLTKYGIWVLPLTVNCQWSSVSTLFTPACFYVRRLCQVRRRVG